MGDAVYRSSWCSGAHCLWWYDVSWVGVTSVCVCYILDRYRVCWRGSMVNQLHSVLWRFVVVSDRVPMAPGKSRKVLDFCKKYASPGKSWKMDLVLESPGNFSKRSWKVLEFSRLWCGRQTQRCRCRWQNLQKLAQIFSVYYEKSLAVGALPQTHPRVTAVCLWTSLAYDRVLEKMFLGPWKI